MVSKHKRILVTGGAGFIGSNLCEFLLERGYAVISIDNFSTGKKQNLETFLHHPNFEFIEGDIRDFDVCLKVVKDCDIVLHQAAIGSVPRSINDPLTTNDVNINGFLNVLIASREARIKRFIYAASSSTYGDSVELPKIEERIGTPLSPYAITKYVNELYAKVFGNTFGMYTIGLRYFNVFGKRQDPDGAYAAVIPKFVLDLMAQRSPVINGDGFNSRDFTHINNVLHMNELAINYDGQLARNEVFNTACGRKTNLIQLFEFIKSELGKFDRKINNIDYVQGEQRIGDIPHSFADVSKAKRVFGYEPIVSINEGLAETVKWYWENNLKNK